MTRTHCKVPRTQKNLPGQTAGRGRPTSAHVAVLSHVSVSSCGLGCCNQERWEDHVLGPRAPLTLRPPLPARTSQLPQPLPGAVSMDSNTTPTS